MSSLVIFHKGTIVFENEHKQESKLEIQTIFFFSSCIFSIQSVMHVVIKSCGAWILAECKSFAFLFHRWLIFCSERAPFFDLLVSL